MAICCIDICSSVAHIPVTVTLFNERAPSLFGNMVVCASWTIVFRYLQMASMFLVMLLSVSRTIAIARPYYTVKKNHVLGVFFCYSFFLILHDVADAYCGKFVYSDDGPFCYTSKAPSCRTAATAVISVEVGLPPIITFTSFLMFCWQAIYKASPVTPRDSRRAATTVALFTGIFLLCNLPYFILMIFYTATFAMNSGYPGPFFNDVFLYYYSWAIGKIVCTVLNATLNPILYYSRMTRFREWNAEVWAPITGVFKN